jgi:hypothetical protein
VLRGTIPFFLSLQTILEQILSYNYLCPQWVTDVFALKELHGLTCCQVGLLAAVEARISEQQ